MRSGLAASSVTDLVALSDAAQLSGVGVGVGGGVGLRVGLTVGVGGSVGDTVGGEPGSPLSVGGGALDEAADDVGDVVAPELVGWSALDVGVNTASSVGVALGDGRPPRNAATTTAMTVKSATAPTTAAISLPRPPEPPAAPAPPMAPAPPPAPLPAPASSVLKRSPHWMQKVRPGGLRRPQFQQITSGGRPAKPVDIAAGWPVDELHVVDDVGSGAGGVGGGGGGGTVTGGPSCACGSPPASPLVPAAADVSSAAFPVHSRNWPQDPQNSSPGLFWKPQFEQITASPPITRHPPDQWLVMSTRTDTFVALGSFQPAALSTKQPEPDTPRTA